MQKLKTLLITLIALISISQSAYGESNPFAKSQEITFGASAPWANKNGVAVKTSQDSDTYYHLQFDGRSLRLTLGTDKTLNPANAKHFEQFAIEDVQIDGNRLPLFQWCLNHQERHARFLQQGLTVEKNICENQGHDGAFVMQLNQDSLAALSGGKTLTYTIKPFRTTIVINYALSDFRDMTAMLAGKKVPAAKQAPAPADSVAGKCVVSPPPGFESIKAVSYDCNSASDKIGANHRMVALVDKERDQRKKAEEEKDRKQQTDTAAKKKAEEDRLQQEAKKKEEAEMIAASKLKQQELNADITAKMLGVCTKMWEKGEHRCYCEKYIDQAPDNIKALSKC